MNIIRFEKEAKDWNQAMPIGNGFMGAMIFGGRYRERIQLNEDSLWSGGPLDRINEDAGKDLQRIRELLQDEKIHEAEVCAARSMYATVPNMRHYQLLSDVWIEFEPMRDRKFTSEDIDNVTQTYAGDDQGSEKNYYSRQLDIAKAVGVIVCDMEEKRITREFFASYPAQAVIYHIKAQNNSNISFDVSAARKTNKRGYGASYCDGIEVLDDHIIRLYGQQGGRDGIGFEMLVNVKCNSGSIYKKGSRVIVENANEAMLFITARTTFRSSQPLKWCLDTLQKIESIPYAELKAEHQKDYEHYFRNCELQLGEDSSLERYTTPERLQRVKGGKTDIGLINTYFNYAKYLMISCSRPGSLPATLQGIWNDSFEPPWGSKYTVNINTEMNYWFVEKAGLSDMHLPLFEHLERMQSSGQEVARRMYHARGFCCHHNTDIWGDCAPQDNYMGATIWPMSGAWLSMHIIEHYLYTKDVIFAKRYFPIIRNSVLFFVDYLFQDKDGEWVTGPTCSPENKYITVSGESGNLCIGATIDIEIVEELFEGYLRLVEELHEAEDLNAEVKEKLAGLPKLKIGKYGQIQEWKYDYEEAEPGHRHISQLYALYPGNKICSSHSEELINAARKTLERRLSYGGGGTGWSKAWIILFYARLKDGNHAMKHLQELLRCATLDNLFDNHPPFQIDGNFGSACGILEMLVQDFENVIYILPALPDALSEGRLSGIKIKGGGELSIQWSEKKVVLLRLTAIHRVCKKLIFNNGYSTIINLNKGETYLMGEENNNEI